MVSESNKIGLVPAILMVAGNMMGSGVFMLPANLAGIGSIAIIGWLITIVGAVSLGLVFAKLTEINTAAGGPYAYAKKAFGDYMGYQTNLVYWLANVIGRSGRCRFGVSDAVFPKPAGSFGYGFGANCRYLVLCLCQHFGPENRRAHAGHNNRNCFVSDNRRCLARLVLV